MAAESYSDDDVTRILRSTKTIVLVGASPDPDRHSNRVMAFMQRNGYRMIPVNPGAAGTEIHGEPVADSLANVADPFDMVAVFRRTDAIPGVVDELLPLIEAKGVRFLWLQLGIHDEASAARAREAGLEVVMDRCLKIEFGRLLSHGG